MIESRTLGSAYSSMASFDTCYERRPAVPSSSTNREDGGPPFGVRGELIGETFCDLDGVAPRRIIKMPNSPTTCTTK